MLSNAEEAKRAARRSEHQAFKWLAILASIGVSIDSVRTVWGSKRPIGDFFEEFIARGLHLLIVFGTFGLSIWLGVRVYDRFHSKAAAWLVGGSVFVLLGLSLNYVVSAIPGVGFRFERIMEANED